MRDISGEVHQLEEWKRRAWQYYQHYLDASVPHKELRWCIFGFLLALYLVRVYAVGGFYIITYALFIHCLYFILPVVTPLVDPESLATDEASLPRSNRELGEEYRPFIPKVPEFKAWKNMMLTVLISTFLTLFWFLDIPVFWPILVLYCLILFFSEASGRVKHMIRYRYVPWNTGKPRFVPKNNT